MKTVLSNHLLVTETVHNLKENLHFAVCYRLVITVINVLASFDKLWIIFDERKNSHKQFTKGVQLFFIFS